MAGWKNKLTFLTPDNIVHKVGGQDVKFYPISVGLAFKLRVVAQPLTKAMTALFTNGQNDVGTEERQIANGQGTYDRETVIKPIDPALAAKRHEQRQKALDDLVTAFLAPETSDVVGKIIMDSMREVFPPGSADNPPPQELVESIPLPMLPDIVVGIAKANKGVFGPLADKLGATFGRIEQSVRAKVESKMGAKMEAKTEPLTPTSSGGDSKTS